MITTHWLDVDASPHGRDARIAVHTAGKGPLALLLHGYPLDHRMWLDTLHGPLAQHRTLATIDLRGHGASPSSGDPSHTMALFAHDAAAVVRSLSDGPADVVGLSMGGYAALALAAEYPDLVRSLVLANTRAVADDEKARAGRDAAIATVIADANGRGALAAAMLAKMLPPHADALLRARVLTMAAAMPVESYVADLRGLRDRADRQALLPTLRVPTLVVTGELDPIASVAESTAMANAIPGARCRAFAGCGHLVPMEAPDPFAAAVAGLWAG
jgi:pimeloyl-ACP methyl ester carboxylesterase